jgi:hypothetical protein
MRAGPVATLRDALVAFRQANGLPADEAANASWSCQLGPLTLRLPNFAWRREAILAHDLHHVLTGYPCTLRGECQTAAWEFAAGRMPHRAAALFCLPLLPLGLVWTPRRMLQAFRTAGARAACTGRSDRRLLAAPLPAARAELARRGPSGRGRIGPPLIILQASAISMAPLALLVGLWLAA